MNGTFMKEEDRKGLLIPPWFVREDITDFDMNLASMLLGSTMSISVFVCCKAGKQTLTAWKRAGNMTPYIIMIWLELAVSLGLAFDTWIYLRGYARASFWIFFFVVFFWSLEIQFLLQIIINRLGLLIVVPGRARKMKWMTGFLITAINISVFCIWVPARLQISHTFIHMNEIWDRTEKVIFACSDLCLNLYFVYLVRSRLINNGLTKYTRVYKMNLALVSVSMTLDVVLIALMSLPNSFVYLLFHPVAYLFKLIIEMHMAELICKVVKASNPLTGTSLMGSTCGSRPCDNLSRIVSAIPEHTPGQHRSVHVCAEEPKNTDCAGIRRTIETSVVIGDTNRRSSSPTLESSNDSTLVPKRSADDEC
ncbi:hypothetical protein F4818DRAFT_446783 [Hypoxylon cercidicola]|nr:hypothetical protein F4818DRAFT_446783 [Hypoxylon cercidicola]